MLMKSCTDEEVIAAAPPKARKALAGTLDLISAARTSQDPTARATVCLDAVRPLIKSHYPNWPARLEDVERLTNIAAAQDDLNSFITDLTLDPASSSANYAKPPAKDDDWLVLSTVHSAKGLEWDRVYLIHAADGAFPSDMALGEPTGIEEEQRLFYVALTRARDHLSIYAPQRLPVSASMNSRHVLGKASRFLTPEARALLEVQTPTGPSGDDYSTTSEPIDIPTLDHLFA